MRVVPVVVAAGLLLLQRFVPMPEADGQRASLVEH